MHFLDFQLERTYVCCQEKRICGTIGRGCAKIYDWDYFRATGVETKEKIIRNCEQAMKKKLPMHLDRQIWIVADGTSLMG
jgi:hypothetical protein